MIPDDSGVQGLRHRLCHRLLLLLLHRLLLHGLLLLQRRLRLLHCLLRLLRRIGRYQRRRDVLRHDGCQLVLNILRLLLRRHLTLALLQLTRLGRRRLLRLLRLLLLHSKSRVLIQ